MRATAAAAQRPRASVLAFPRAPVERELDDEVMHVAEHVVEAVEPSWRARRLAVSAHVEREHTEAPHRHLRGDLVPLAAALGQVVQQDHRRVALPAKLLVVQHDAARKELGPMVAALRHARLLHLPRKLLRHLHHLRAGHGVHRRDATAAEHTLGVVRTQFLGRIRSGDVVKLIHRWTR